MQWAQFPHARLCSLFFSVLCVVLCGVFVLFEARHSSVKAPLVLVHTFTAHLGFHTLYRCV